MFRSPPFPETIPAGALAEPPGFTVLSGNVLGFFFLAFGRCRTEARSLHEHKQSERHLYKDPRGPSKLANQNKPEKHKTRKSPSQICVSSRENSKPDKKTGQGPNKKTTTTKICQRTQRIYHCASGNVLGLIGAGPDTSQVQIS